MAGRMDATPARQWLVERFHKLNHYINGAWVGPSSASYLDTPSPFDADIVARVADGTAKDTDRAAAAARAALAGWEALGGLERADYLTAIAYGLREQDRLLASMQLLCQAGDELPPATVEDSLERAFLHLADWTRTTEPGVLSVGTHGAYALIVPPGNPLQTVAWELASWLARGSTIVLKPSGFSSSVAVLLAQVAHDSGLPPGVFNLLLGDDKAAGLLGAHWDVQLPPKHPGNGVPA